MSKVLMLVPQRNFNDTEFSVTKKGLEEKGVEVTVTSITTEYAMSMKGEKIQPEKELRLTNSNNYDALVIIGGSGTPQLLDYPEVIDRVKKFNGQGKLIAAICLAPIILAKAGILKGVMSTVFPADFAISQLKDRGATYTKKPVVEDGNIITANGPKSAEEFVEKILNKFNL